MLVSYVSQGFLHTGSFPWISAHAAPAIRTAPQRVCALYLQDSREKAGHLPSAVHDRACGKGYEEVSPEGKVLSKLGDVFSRLGSKGLSRVSFLLLFFFFFWVSFLDQGGSKKRSIQPLNAKQDGNTWNHTSAHSKEQPVMRFSSLSISQKRVKSPLFALLFYQSNQSESTSSFRTRYPCRKHKKRSMACPYRYGTSSTWSQVIRHHETLERNRALLVRSLNFFLVGAKDGCKGNKPK